MLSVFNRTQLYSERLCLRSKYSINLVIWNQIFYKSGAEVGTVQFIFDPPLHCTKMKKSTIIIASIVLVLVVGGRFINYNS